jgi:predicted RNA-binding protein YlxR (DUF448 family)
MTAIRSCVACGARAAKRELRRFVREGQGLRLDPAQRATGRGAYLHRDPECIRRFAGAKGPIRSLRWAPSPGTRAALATEVEHLSSEPR